MPIKRGQPGRAAQKGLHPQRSVLMHSRVGLGVGFRVRKCVGGLEIVNDRELF